MYKYKIVASDLDGTLLNNKSLVSEENAKAIAELNKKGIYFVPATGRTFSEIPSFLKDNENIRFIMHTNGAVIHDKKTGKHIRNCMDIDLANEVFDLLTKYDVHIAVRANGNTYVDANLISEDVAEHYGFTEAHVICINNFAIPVENFAEWMRTAINVEDFSVFFGSPEAFEDFYSHIANDKRLKTAKFPPQGLEIFSVSAGKGRALHLLADELGFEHSDTIGVGDSLNDFTMVEAAGLGLAVSNACDALKEIADEVICSNEEHSIDYINKHYCK